LKKETVVFAGGGTGGHVYPAVAVARELQRRRPDLEIHFVGSTRGLENKIVPKEGFALHTLQVSGLVNMGLASKLKTLILLPLAFAKSFFIILKLRPRFVLGVGGFAAGPFVLMSSFLVRNTYIWEPNAHPGFTNRILSHFVRKCFVVFDDARKKLKSKMTVAVGLPVRSSIQYQPRTPSKTFRILVFGGSQGARPINNAIAEIFTTQKEKVQGIDLVHQTGALDFERISKMYHNTSAVTCVPFIENMSQYYQWADLVIGRGGVGTVSEIIACRKAAVIIPLATAAENHQQANAEVLVRAKAGELLLQKDLTPEKLIEVITRFRNHPELVETFENNLVALQKPNGAARILDEIMKDL
jgi:UDP-N-acetylglucosamine--N-acetylmuramyl-(pentapeptide) pyrophosphoryl-undecaprenol N-acetylglucosamine transferase